MDGRAGRALVGAFERTPGRQADVVSSCRPRRGVLTRAFSRTPLPQGEASTRLPPPLPRMEGAMGAEQAATDEVRLVASAGWDARILICRCGPLVDAFIVVTARYVVIVDTLINPRTARA